MSVCKRSVLAALGLIALAAGGPSAKADFLLESQSLTVDRKDQTADFSLTFNQAPDFTTLDSLGRPANSFQIEYAANYDPSIKFQKSLTGIVRGDEIHIADDLRIRSANGNGGPDAGGWGPIVGSVPFSLIGDTVSFSIPTVDLGGFTKTSAYDVFSLAYGKQTVNQFVTMVPTPAAFPSGLAGLAIVGGVSLAIRKRSVSAHRAS
jgi:hypothetical protein